MILKSATWLRLDEWVESVRMALTAIRAHKLRSSLTLLGVMIGVFSIILVMTAMRALQKNVESELSGLGANTFQIQRWPGLNFGRLENWEKFARRRRITQTDVKILAERATLASSVGGQEDFWAGQAVSRYDQSPPNVNLLGVTPGTFPARNWTLSQGRVFTEFDLDSTRDICILGSSLEKILFPFGSAMGETVKFDGIPYKIVGVLEPRGIGMGSDQDKFALIPLSTGMQRYGGPWRSVELLIQAPDAASYEDTVDQVRGILRALRKVPPGAEDDFEIFSNDSLKSQFESFTLTARIGVAAVSSIALIAAGIGIMNIMLVSVTERTREIGIRRAVGAKKRNILFQFLAEAVVLCELGGLAGVIAGLGAGNIAARVLHLPMVVPVDWIILGLLICSAVGIIFGVYPARKAAHLDPIESLRYE